MLVTDEFVFVHVPKTGGTFLKAQCRKHLEAWEPEGDFHLPYSQLTAPQKRLPAICFVRNPWDWYVSFFHDQQKAGKDDDFGAMIRRTCRTQPDVYTRMFFKVAAQDGVRAGRVRVGRFERLREDFVAFLDEHSIAAPGLRESIGGAPPERVNERTHYRDYYTPELRELVRQSRMTRRYGYEF